MTLQQLSLFTENRNPNHPPTVYSGTHVIAQKRVTEDSVMLRSLKKKKMFSRNPSCQSLGVFEASVTMKHYLSTLTTKLGTSKKPDSIITSSNKKT